MTETPITLTLHLRTDGDHLAGEAHAPDGRAVPFSGRIGLMCAIDALVTADGADPDRRCADTPRTAEESR